MEEKKLENLLKEIWNNGVDLGGVKILAKKDYFFVATPRVLGWEDRFEKEVFDRQPYCCDRNFRETLIRYAPILDLKGKTVVYVTHTTGNPREHPQTKKEIEKIMTKVREVLQEKDVEELFDRVKLFDCDEKLLLCEEILKQYGAKEVVYDIKKL
ncbi:hypothetical protein AYK26_02395 [Euryarchaeota archaeon SM23-78]|nr:MAG: hypothetical protein AYK26_02395 [Euryarchaeota archaeon SM23-78]MBW3000873.1 hypothetical protein [Candidatus Woesearchaeota archaeon]